MNALNEFVKEKKTKELNKLKVGMGFKNYLEKNKYFFNEIYKNKILPKEELVNVVNKILEDEGEGDKDILLKKIAGEFVKDHHELFEKTPDSNTEENEIENDVENQDEKPVEKTPENDVINAKIEALKEDIDKKFNDMIDAHIDLKKIIEEKRNITNQDAKARIENIEGKIEMLYGKQMEDSTTKKKQYYHKPMSKDDVLSKFINNKLNK